ncbi:MAG: hypothetical protein II470_06015 [Selenomonas sp.]|nr:hypothetical protein [Selenomonas sp.]
MTKHNNTNFMFDKSSVRKHEVRVVLNCGGTFTVNDMTTKQAESYADHPQDRVAIW